MSLSRRGFIAANAAAASVFAPQSSAVAAAPGSGRPVLEFDPNDPTLVYDVLVSGGTVVDPANHLNARRHVAVFRLVEGPVDFVDTMNDKRSGTKVLEPVKVVRGGRPYGFRFPNPFTYF